MVPKGRSLRLLIPHPVLQESTENIKTLRKRNKSHSPSHLKINPLNGRKQGRWLISQALWCWLQGESRLWFTGQAGAIVPHSHAQEGETGPSTWGHHPGTAPEPGTAPQPGTPNLSGTHRSLCTAKQLSPSLLFYPEVWLPAALAEPWAAASNGPQTQEKNITAWSFSTHMRNQWRFPLPWFWLKGQASNRGDKSLPTPDTVFSDVLI